MIRRLLARFLLWALPMERRERLLALVAAEEERQAQRTGVRRPRRPFLPWDVAAESGEWTDVFRLGTATLTAADVQHLRDNQLD